MKGVVMNHFSSSCFSKQKAFADSISGDNLLILWSFLEAICWFVFPDFLIVILSVLAPQKTKRWIALSTASSFFGTVTLFCSFRFLPLEAFQVMFHLPFTHTDMLSRIEKLGSIHGYTSILFQPFSGIPAKVWSYSAYHTFHWNIFAFLLLLTSARSIRMLIAAWLARTTINMFSGFIPKYWLPLLAAYTIIFFIFLSLTS
jgi:hypothetical protein